MNEQKDRERQWVATALKPNNGQFQPGNHLGGRPLGSRNRLSETMLTLLAADAAQHGAAVIEEVRRTRPDIWLRCMCALLPRQLQVEKFSPFSDLSDEELATLEQYLRAARAHQINGKAEPSEP